MSTTSYPNIVSVDDHVVEPPRLWQERLPQKFRERGPRVVRSEVSSSMNLHGGTIQADASAAKCLADVWEYEDLRLPYYRVSASAGCPREEITMTPITYDDMRPGYYDRDARLADMDQNGVDISLCFPNTFVRFCGQTFSQSADKDLGLACIRAYNDWNIEEWAGPSRGRLVPLPILPLWDVKLAAAEAARMAEKGATTVCFSEVPPFLGLPSIHSGYWNPLFDVCSQNRMTLQLHIGSGSKFITTSDDAPNGVITCTTFITPALALTDWVLSGVFETHPELRICLSESQIGWIPYVLERMDIIWSENMGWNEYTDKLSKPPSEYYRDHVYVAYFQDDHGIRSIGEIGVDQVCIETDYPHPDSTWPNSMKLVERLAEQVTPDVLYKVVRGNALRMMGVEDRLAEAAVN